MVGNSKDTYDIDRVKGFSDGVIAIAVTLLALDVRLPELPEHISAMGLNQALIGLLPTFAAFALSFYVIARLWMSHVYLLKEVHAATPRFMSRNLGFLFLIAVIPFTTTLISTHGDQAWPTIIYATSLAAAGFWLTLMWRYLSRHPEIHRKNDVEIAMRAHYAQSFVTPGVFLISIPLAFWHPWVAQITWLAVLVLRGGLLRRIGRA